MTRPMVTEETIAQAVGIACRAPSIHNSQPWRWDLDSGTLDLHLDTDRLVATDTSGRQALISCGVALHHLRVAIAASGWTSHVNYYPHADNHTHLAAIHFTESPTVTDTQRQRADAILRRHTDRLPFAAPQGGPALAGLLRDAVDRAAYVDVLGADAHPQLAEATQLVDTLRIYDSHYHTELQWWTAPFGVTDGIPPSALLSAAESDRVSIGRTFPVTTHRDRRGEVPEDRSSVVVLSTPTDTRLDILHCGEALSAVLLEATVAGLATCTLTHLTELPDSIAVVSALTGRPRPQVLIRIGLSPSLEAVPPPTPRRRTTDVLHLRL